MHPRKFNSRVSPHSILIAAFFLILACPVASAQQANSSEVQELRALVLQLQQRVDKLEAQQATNSAPASSQPLVAAAQPVPAPPPANQVSAALQQSAAPVAQTDHEAIAASAVLHWDLPL